MKRVALGEPNSNCVNKLYPLVDSFGAPLVLTLSTQKPLFPNGFAAPVSAASFSGSETESPGTEHNRQGFGRTPRFLPPNSQFLW